MIKNFFRHLHMINRHRFIVFKLCLKCGSFWRGLFHDLSKYSFIEFWEGVKYYNGRRSPISKCRENIGYSKAWLHHKGRNKHHIEYWYDKENKEQMNIPYKYAVECVCDKIAATKCYNKKEYRPEMVLAHWSRVGIHAPANDNMKTFFTTVFTDLAEHGEKFVLNKKYLKATYTSSTIKDESIN